MCDVDVNFATQFVIRCDSRITTLADLKGGGTPSAIADRHKRVCSPIIACNNTASIGNGIVAACTFSEDRKPRRLPMRRPSSSSCTKGPLMRVP
jgi:hypothetical protein